MKLISVTQALKPFSKFDHIPQSVLKPASERGSRIHAAAAAKLSGTFLVSQLLPEDLPLWDSLERWIDANVQDVIAVEPELIDDGLGFVGHPDLIAVFNRQLAVIDFKTGQTKSKTWGPQVAAYRHLAVNHYGKKHIGLVVQSAPDGSARGLMVGNTDKDLQVFLQALNLYRYFEGCNP